MLGRNSLVSLIRKVSKKKHLHLIQFKYFLWHVMLFFVSYFPSFILHTEPYAPYKFICISKTSLKNSLTRYCKIKFKSKPMKILKTYRSSQTSGKTIIFFTIVEYLEKKLKNLKDNLKECLENLSSLTKSGAAAFSLPKCEYFDEMAFLSEKRCNRPSESNLQLQ